jgi:trk system potassium uptake protein TrkA
LGGDHVGTAIAEQLQTDGHTVRLVDEISNSEEDPRIQASLTDVELLSEAGLEAATSVVVGTRSDARNFLIAQVVRAHFDVSRITVLVNDPRRLSAMADAGIEPICVTTVLSEAVTSRI